MREGPLALERALESGDTDLVYLALLHLRRQHLGAAAVASGSTNVDPAAQDAFLRVVLAYPAAIDLLAAYLRDRMYFPTFFFFFYLLPCMYVIPLFFFFFLGAPDPLQLVRLYTLCGRYADAGLAQLTAAAEAANEGDGIAGGGEVFDIYVKLLEK
jgi:hypothetical protein